MLIIAFKKKNLLDHIRPFESLIHYNQVVKHYIGRSSFAIHAIHQSVGRELNSSQSCSVVAITEAALPHCTSMEIFWILH